MNLRNVASVALQRCIKVYNNSKLLISIYHNPVIYIRYTFYKIGRIVLIATLQRQRLQRIDCTNLVCLIDSAVLSGRQCRTIWQLSVIYLLDCLRLVFLYKMCAVSDQPFLLLYVEKIFPTRGNFCGLTKQQKQWYTSLWTTNLCTIRIFMTFS